MAISSPKGYQMKKYWALTFILVILGAGLAWAATPGILCTTIGNTPFSSCVPVSISSPLPVISN